MRKKKIRLGGSPLTKIVLQGVFTGLVLKVLSMELVPPKNHLFIGDLLHTFFGRRSSLPQVLDCSLLSKLLQQCIQRLSSVRWGSVDLSPSAGWPPDDDNPVKETKCW